MKALPPRHPDDASDLEVGLQVANEGICMAISAILDDATSNHRFEEVQRLSIIGRALERQRARTRRRVEDFVAPGAIHDGAGGHLGVENLGGLGRGMACYGGPPRQRAGMEGLEDLDEPFDDVRPVNHLQNPAFIGAPYGLQNDPNNLRNGDPNTALSGLVQVLAGTVAGVAASKEEEMKSQRRKDLADEIHSLVDSFDKAKDEATRERLFGLLDKAMGSLEKLSAASSPSGSEAADDSAQHDDLLRPPPRPRHQAQDAPEIIDLDPPQERPGEDGEQLAHEPYVSCTSPRCGNVHGNHWRGRDGRPLNCEICGSRMNEQPPPAAVAAEQAAHAP